MRPHKALDGKTSSLPTYMHGIEKCVFSSKMVLKIQIHLHKMGSSLEKLLKPKHGLTLNALVDATILPPIILQNLEELSINDDVGILYLLLE
jgi:hypothetical protein